MRKQNGFTLMELMITVLIIGILAAIAIPAYDNYVVRSKRADAMASLQAGAAALERYRAANNFVYTGAVLVGCTAPCSAIFANQVPVEGGEAYYNLLLTIPAGGTTFSLRATPTGSMLGKDGPLTMTNTGTKTWTDKNGVMRACWPTSGNDC